MQAMGGGVPHVQKLPGLKAEIPSADQHILHVIGIVAVVRSALDAAIDERIVQHGAIPFGNALQTLGEIGNVTVPESRETAKGGA